jgi:hypothetical protein
MTVDILGFLENSVIVIVELRSVSCAVLVRRAGDEKKDLIGDTLLANKNL